MLKLITAAGLLIIYYFIPDQSLLVVGVKLGLIIIIAIFTPGFSSLKSWTRVLAFLAAFLFLIYSVTYLGILVSGKGNLVHLRRLALKSFWMVNISFLFTISFHYRELIYLFQTLKVPPALSAQVLLIFLIWSKLFAEFRQVPLVWKSRGVTAGMAGKKGRLVLDLLKVVLLRTLRGAARLERALLSRGFGGRLYTFWRKGERSAF